MPGTTLGTAYVQIVPSTQGIAGSISSVMGGEATAAGGGDGLQRQSIKIAVTQADALGRAGGAAGIENGGAIVGVAAVFWQLQDVCAGDQCMFPRQIALLGELAVPSSGQRIQEIFWERQPIGCFSHQHDAIVGNLR